MRSTASPVTRIAGALVFLREGSQWRALARDLWIEDGQIRRIGDPQEPRKDGETIVDAAGCLVAPGLINAHTHSPLSSLRGTTDGLGHVGFMWRNQADTAGRDPQEVYDHALAQALEALATGTTAMIDHFPEQNPTREMIDAAAQAYLDAGIRCNLALRIFDGAYDDILPDPSTGLVPPDPSPLAPGSIDGLIGLCDEAAARWHGAGDRLAVLPGPSNPLRCSDDLLRASAELAEARDLGLHAHMLETRRQREISRARHGVSNVARLDRLGILSDRWSLAHCVWVDEDDRAALAASGAVPVHNPASNAKLGVGTAPVAAMRDQAITVALGTDGASTSDSLDLHEAIWLAALVSRGEGKGIGAADAYDLATVGGARALRQPGVTGRIEAGAVADLVFYDLDDPSLCPLNDPVQQLVFAVRGGAVCRTMVAGRSVYERSAEAEERLREVRLRLARSRPAAASRDPELSRFADAMAALDRPGGRMSR
ncbi:amidohydrolase family protein [Jiella avicenniae]|uniref:Amidohydrolase family protein n=1 Tax=Jiella avicenniae TaxID=2907202 RepID=A0A9X1NYP2_9HYPH|nr:amidohydrolase family protein [Jiella avicenniae]MCE7027140.1 amidohydrolase family protein [Jiella avicenniae]